MLKIWHEDTRNWTTYKKHVEEFKSQRDFDMKLAFLKSCSDVRNIVTVCPRCNEKYDIRYQENEMIWGKKHNTIIGCRHEKLSKCSGCGRIFNPKRENEKCPHKNRKINLTSIQLKYFKFHKAS